MMKPRPHRRTHSAPSRSLGRWSVGSRFGGRYRVLGVGLLVLFLAGWVIDVGALHDCPHHGLPAGQTQAGEHYESRQAAHDHGAEAAHHAPQQDPPSAAESAPSHDGHDHDVPCACRTDCAGAAAIREAVSPSSPADLLPELDGGPIGGASEWLSHHFLLPHVLPWSTAPPVA